MREVQRLALEMYCYRLKKYIRAYYAVLGRVDTIVFTAGVGENNPWIRQRACEGLCGLGIRIDEQKNDRRVTELFDVHDGKSNVTLLVVPTNEELEIAHQTVACIRSQRR